MRGSVFLKLLAAFLLVIGAATAILDYAVRRSWEGSLRRDVHTSLVQKCRMFAQRVESDRSRPLQQIVDEQARAAEARATVIDSTGKVLADSEAKAGEMENHAARPEFQSALAGGTGSSTRTSHTVGIEFLYVAVPIQGGAVRLAYPLSSVRQAIAAVRWTLLVASAIALGIAALIAAVLSQLVTRRLRRIVAFADRIAAGDLKARIAESSYDEIAQVATALDRTARRLEASFAAVETSRRELATLLDSMQEAVIGIGADGKLLWANGAMNRLLRGSVRLDAPVVETVRDPELLSAIEHALVQRASSNARSSSLISGRTFEVTVSPMPPGGVVAVLHDLTAGERVEKTRRDFIANVSHELRTPLTSIQGYTETMLDVPEHPQTREFLEIILKNAQRMARLTEDLLSLARVESGERRFVTEAVAASELLQDAADTFRQRAQTAGVALEIEACPEQAVVADAQALHQVFGNLIDNALRYAVGSRVVLGARAAGDALEFYVRDFGTGIASEHLPRLFERFYRVDKTRSRETGGTGLGLAIVKHIIRAHGGEVRAESELGRGTTFCFTLPLAPLQRSEPVTADSRTAR